MWKIHFIFRDFKPLEDYFRKYIDFYKNIYSLVLIMKNYSTNIFLQWRYDIKDR